MYNILNLKNFQTFSFYADKMEDWDDKKLAEVVQKKHGAHNTKIKKKNKTAIVREVLMFVFVLLYAYKVNWLRQIN